MTTIGIYEPGGFTASSYYRSFGALRKLPDTRIVEVSRAATVNSLYTIDIFFAARPYEDVDAKMIALAKDIGLPVWVDFDDDFWNIPHTNPAHWAYHGKVESINRCLSLADVVTVSTEHLAELVRKQVPAVKKVVAINNAVESLINPIEPKATDKICIGWRGTATHTRDLEVWRDVFHRLHQSNKFEFVFMGHVPPWNIAYRYHRFTDFFSFRRAFAQSGIDFLLYPLEHCQFNLSKSNIAWLEATSVGAATFASLRTNEWKYSGIGHDVENLLSKSPTALEKLRQKMVEDSRMSILEGFTLDYTTTLRADILKMLI